MHDGCIQALVKLSHDTTDWRTGDSKRCWTMPKRIIWHCTHVSGVALALATISAHKALRVNGHSKSAMGVELDRLFGSLHRN